MNGRFIVLEGPDGSGTTTHAKLLAERLQASGTDVLLTCEPTNGPIGAFIRTQLAQKGIPADALQMLFTADRAWHVAQDIKPALEAGKTVISDRYWLSTVVYAEALGIDPEPLAYLNKKFIQPDIQILLLPPFEVCLERIGSRSSRDILEEDSLQKRVYEGYKKSADKEVLTVIDSSQDLGQVAEAVARAVVA